MKNPTVDKQSIPSLVKHAQEQKEIPKWVVYLINTLYKEYKKK